MGDNLCDMFTFWDKFGNRICGKGNDKTPDVLSKKSVHMQLQQPICLNILKCSELDSESALDYGKPATGYLCQGLRFLADFETVNGFINLFCADTKECSYDRFSVCVKMCETCFRGVAAVQKKQNKTWCNLQ